MRDDGVLGRVRRALAKSREPDPHVVARRLLGRLSDAEREELVVWGIEQMAREVVRIARMRPSEAQESPGRVAVGVSRWKTVVPERVWTGVEHKFIEDCCCDDLIAYRIVRESTEPREEPSTASQNGHRGGLKGGPARANTLSPERRSEIARKAAEARWRKTSTNS